MAFANSLVSSLFPLKIISIGLHGFSLLDCCAILQISDMLFSNAVFALASMVKSDRDGAGSLLCPQNKFAHLLRVTKLRQSNFISSLIC